jgi:hypothetical protein
MPITHYIMYSTTFSNCIYVASGLKILSSVVGLTLYICCMIIIYTIFKAIPTTGRGGLQGCETR